MLPPHGVWVTEAIDIAAVPSSDHPYLTSSIMIRSRNRGSFAMKPGSSSTPESLDLRLQCSMTRAFISGRPLCG